MKQEDELRSEYIIFSTDSVKTNKRSGDVSDRIAQRLTKRLDTEDLPRN